MLFYHHIDWTQAWFASILPSARSIIADTDWRHAINQLAFQKQLANHQNLPLRFIAQEELPEGVAYESHISQTGQVPTRENLHDFFNALVWLSFPLIKRQLNAMQAAQIDQLGIGKSRGSARDAATIFDENAAILVLADDEQGHALCSNLRAHEWQNAFIEKADMFHHFHPHQKNNDKKKAHVWTFGHALMEKLVTPYKAITAHTWVIWAPNKFFSAPFHSQQQWIDQHISQQLQEKQISTADYTPLPVLGIPHWWPGQNQDFYQDTFVFRPKRNTK